MYLSISDIKNAQLNLQSENHFKWVFHHFYQQIKEDMSTKFLPTGWKKWNMQSEKIYFLKKVEANTILFKGCTYNSLLQTHRQGQILYQ